MLISIVVPVYNSTVMDQIVERTTTAFARRAERLEFVFVDDHSPNPAVWPALSALAQRHPHVRAIRLTRNFGQHAATLCGLREARGDCIVTMDDDLEHSPEDIPALVDCRPHDVALAQFREKQHGWITRTGSRVKAVCDWLLLGKPRHIHFSSFRMLGREVVDGMLAIRAPHPFLPALILHVTRDLVGVEVAHGRRITGQSNYTLAKRIRLLTDLVVHNSSFVLRMVGHVGLVFSAVSFVLFVLVVYRKLMHGIAITGWASLFAAQMLIGGLLLFALGIIGEYLVRLIEGSEARPAYVVRQRVGGEAPEQDGQGAVTPQAATR